MTISEIQKRLAELGFYDGAVDAVSGPRTRAAIRGAQRWHGLRDDGIVGPKTKDALWPAPIPGRDLDAHDEVSLPLIGHNQPWPRQGDVPAFYGAMGKQQTILKLPFPMWLAWDKRKPVKQFSVHKKVHDSAARAFARIAEEYGPKERQTLGIDLFGGCLNVRRMRGGSAWSTHSWGIAIDFDPARNTLNMGRDKARLALPDAERFWRIWEDEGWVSLGRTRNFDFMHVQAARL